MSLNPRPVTDFHLKGKPEAVIIPKKDLPPRGLLKDVDLPKQEKLNWGGLIQVFLIFLEVFLIFLVYFNLFVAEMNILEVSYVLKVAHGETPNQVEEFLHWAYIGYIDPLEKWFFGGVLHA